MNDNYLINIKSCDHKIYKIFLSSKITYFIFKEYIFPFLSSFEFLLNGEKCSVKLGLMLLEGYVRKES